ncbi:MAG: PD40 domain-containing protein [Chloroflexi bacterium]|nr:PD40 domain-containing protein [Chloroflexota bacterium]
MYRRWSFLRTIAILLFLTVPLTIAAQSEEATAEPTSPPEIIPTLTPIPPPTETPTATPEPTLTETPIPAVTPEVTASLEPTASEPPPATLIVPATETPPESEATEAPAADSAPVVVPAAMCDPNAAIVRAPLPSNEGAGLEAVSADGRYVVLSKYVRTDWYGSTYEFILDFYLYDRLTCQTALLPNYPRDLPLVYFPGRTSADGRFVVGSVNTGRLFQVEDFTRLIKDVFVLDRQTGQETIVSVAANGGLSDDSSGKAMISADGRYIVYESQADNLVLNPPPYCIGEQGDPPVHCPVILVYDRQTGQNTRVLQSSGPSGSNRYEDNNFVSLDDFSANGQRIAYSRSDDCLMACTYGLIYDLPSGTITDLPVNLDGDGLYEFFTNLRISGDGRYVAYVYNPSTGTPGSFDQVIVYDSVTGQYEYVSAAPNRALGNAHSGSVSLSLDGRYLAFSSDASNLVSGDTNNVRDVFVYDRQTHRNTRVSVGAGGAQANGVSGNRVAISGDGQYVAFESEASNLVADDTNGVGDVFLAKVVFPPLSQPPLPQSPTLIAPTSGTLTNSTSLTFSWTAAPNAEYYRLLIDDDRDFSSPVEAAHVFGLSYTSTSLFDHQLYWRVEAINSAGIARSAIWYFTIDTTPPAAPALRYPLNNSVITMARPSFSWLAVPTANRYRLQIARDAAFMLILSDTDTDLLAAAPVTLRQGYYYWRVQARDAAGNWGTFSEVRGFELNILRSPAQRTDVSTQRPTFQWYAYPGARAYQLQVDDSMTFDSPIVNQTIHHLQTSFQPAALPYGQYYWRVNVDTGGGFVPSPVFWEVAIRVIGLNAPVLTAPLNGAVVTSPVTLSWNAVSGGETYEFIIDNDPTFYSPEARYVDSPSGTSIFLPPGRYYWKVRAWNAANQPGAWSVPRSFTVSS